MILVFGGTTEGKQAISVLQELDCPFVYSTKTKVEMPVSIPYRYGVLNSVHLKQLILDQDIDLIINCSHPFAEQLHATIDEVATLTKTTVLRLEREYPQRTNHSLVTYIEGYEEAIEVLARHSEATLLALTGVQSIPKLKKHWSTTKSYFRILDRQISIDIATESGFPHEQLILGLTDKSLDAELQTIEDKGIEIILTKESGESGGLSVKITAAIQRNIPILIIRKPKLPQAFECVYSLEELRGKISDELKRNDELRVKNYELREINDEFGVKNYELKGRKVELGVKNDELKVDNEELGINNSKPIIHNLESNSNQTRNLESNSNRTPNSEFITNNLTSNSNPTPNSKLKTHNYKK